MPAIITHDSFAREIYRAHFAEIGQSRDECHAFLLGAQGPDVLFYGSANPVVAKMGKVGSEMHRQQPTDLLAEFARVAASAARGGAGGGGGGGAGAERGAAAEAEAGIARAYALGFLCHYELDCACHPLIYAQQHALCAAGEPGLDESSAHEVHATIESELDELVLTVKRRETITTFDPSSRILQASPRVVSVVSKMYVDVAQKVYGRTIGEDAFRRCVTAFRQVQRIVYSTSGIKREALGRFETLFRRHSFLRALSHRNVKMRESIFDNHEHFPWYFKENDEVITKSFWEIYDDARVRTCVDLRAYAAAIDLAAGARQAREVVHAITQGKNFHGVLAEAVVVDGPAWPKVAKVNVSEPSVCYNLLN